MCGIAGFSLRSNSTVNARELAHALLSGIEQRGSHAAGFAFTMNKKMGYYKDAVRGSQLPLQAMPRDAKTVILHTRFATHGAVSDNTNNHPVFSPDGTIALTHNGVISNDEKIREGLPAAMQDKIPEVDTAVIPALLQEGTFRDFRKLAGYAAVAWLVKGEQDVLHLGRLKTSPVVWTMLHDGSFVYASTEPILRNALRKIGLWHGGMMTLEEHDYIQVSNGVIVASDVLPHMTYETYNSYSRYSNATSGGHGGRNVTPIKPEVKPAPKAVSPAKFVAGVKGSENAPHSTSVEVAGTPSSKPPIGASFGRRAWSEDDDEAIDAMVDKFAAQLDEKGISSGSMTDAEWEEYLSQRTPGVFDDEVDSDPDDADFPGAELFYTIDNLGNQEGYTSLDALETTLKWHAGLTPRDDDFFKAEGLARWCEHFVDVGEIDNIGTMVSWVDNRDNILKFDPDSNDESLEYVRQGVDLLLPHRRIH